MPDAAISTDIIVGFPGETEEDFQATLDVVEKSRFATAFTFQYSKRPGTPAADLPDQLPKEVVQARFLRLTALQDRIAAEENAAQLGRKVEVMVTASSGRKAAETHRLSGRAQDQRLVHLRPATQGGKRLMIDAIGESGLLFGAINRGISSGIDDDIRLDFFEQLPERGLVGEVGSFAGGVVIE